MTITALDVVEFFWWWFWLAGLVAILFGAWGKSGRGEAE